MDFSEVIKDIEALVGKELQPLNPNTGVITIMEIDHDHRNYSIKPEDGRSKKRSFSELEKIWEKLLVERAVSVESVLEGAGSSRNQPETILSNLPYVDFFKYKKRKHLYFIALMR